MASINKVILLGRIGMDPELIQTHGGNSVVNLSLATDRQYTDKSGQKTKETEWHSVVLFGRQAEVVEQYCRKGDSIYIEGRLTTRKFQKKDGSTVYKTEIIAESMQFVSTKKDRDQQNSGSRSQSRTQDQDYEEDCPF